MPQKYLPLFLIILFCGCFRGYSYNGAGYSYVYGMADSSDSLEYNNETINAKFSIDKTSINYTLTNKSEEPIKILWDDASIVQYGEAKKIMHKGVKYDERNNAQSPTTIPPHAMLSDLALPSEHVFFEEYRHGVIMDHLAEWKESPLFPIEDRDETKIKNQILALKGESFSLYLPIQKSGKLIGYSFNFKILDVGPVVKATTQYYRDAYR